MPFVKMKNIIQNALKGQYIVAAFNIFNLDTFSAVIEGAQNENSPVIVQVSMGARKYIPNMKAFVHLIQEMAEDVDVPVALNHDHCPTPEDAMKAIDWGFTGAMFDGSHLPFEENVRKTQKLVEYAHKFSICVEAELGQLPGFEDMYFAEHSKFTDPEKAKEFVKETGCDSLAVSVGTSHGGVFASEPLPLHFEILKAIHSVLPEFPLVLHGAASLPKKLVEGVNKFGGTVEQLRNCTEEDIAKCRRYGVCKANMDVDNFLCYTREVRRFLIETPEKYDPRLYLLPARKAFCEEVEHKIRNVVKSSGKNWR